jgi:ferric-dicitrate binding protein FerR (iron transport regulator)
VSNTELQRDRQSALSRILGQATPGEDAEERMTEGALRRMQQQRTRQGNIKRGLAVAAAAAVVLAALGAGRWLALPTVPERPRVAVAPLAKPPVWTATDRPASFTLGPHRIELSAGGKLSLERAEPSSPRLSLQEGQAGFRVQPLGEGGSFVVQTRHVRVEVVGTAFRVIADERCSQVRVSEGKVRATVLTTAETHLLDAGKERSFCGKPVLSESLGPGAKMVRRALFLLASGEDLAQADRLLTRYLERYPKGPFVEEALFHRVFATRRQGQEEQAKSLARDFLRRFPDAPRAARLRDWLEKSGPGADQN